MPINRPDRYPGDGWGDEDEGTLRTDDCIDELSFGVGTDDEDDEDRWGSL